MLCMLNFKFRNSEMGKLFEGRHAVCAVHVRCVYEWTQDKIIAIQPNNSMG